MPSHRIVARRATRAAQKQAKADAFTAAMLSIRGCYDPPKFVLDRLTTGDRLEYENAKKQHDA
jgi:hypothetical protein